MSRLERDYANDSRLLNLYKVKLLIPGWAGQVDDAEAEYIVEKLKSDRKLYLKWRKALKKVGYFKILSKPSIEAVKKWVWDLRCIDIS
jgi:hypothetical protein